jgi:N-acetylmuramoyl-L-alanine amidase
VPYDSSERDRRKKAFIRKRKRKRLLVILSLFAVALGLLVLIVCLTVGLIKKLIKDHDEKMAYVEYTGEYADVWLVDNSNTGRNGQALFYEIEDTPEDNTAADTITPDPKAEKYKDIIPGSKGLVIVDAGHGGYDGGAEANGVLEKDLNLEISYKLKDELILRGYTVYLTRPEDEFVGLNERASLANRQDDPVCLISIHQNSLDEEEGSASGLESWTYNREGCIELGDAVAEAVSKKTGTRNRGTRTRTNLVVTSKTTMPAIIFECGYVTDSEEAKKLADDKYQELIVEGIVDGIDQFVKDYY